MRANLINQNGGKRPLGYMAELQDSWNLTFPNGVKSVFSEKVYYT